MDNKQFLKEMFDAVVKNDDEAAKAAFELYVTAKSRQLLAEKAAAKSPIKLKGTDLFVNDKKVGTVKHDVDDDKGIEFTADGGKAKKFDNIQDLYKHVGELHKLNEASTAYDVFLKGKLIDTVFDSETDPAEVKRSLVDHDGFDANITVKKAKDKKKSVKEGKDTLYALYTKKKGTEKWGIQFSGTRAECNDEWTDTKHDWEGYDHKVAPAEQD